MKRGMASTGTEISCCVAGPKAARSASDRLSRIRQNASAWASLAEITASLDQALVDQRREQPGEQLRRLLVIGTLSAVASTSACQGMLAGQRRPSARNMAERPRSATPAAGSRTPRSGRSRPPARAACPAPPAGLASPSQATAREWIAGTKLEPGRGDDPKRPFGADQQLVEAVAAIVLLEARQAVMDRAVGQHRLDPVDQRRASGRSAAPACRRHWSRSARRSSRCPWRRGSAESAVPRQRLPRAAFAGPPRLRPRRAIDPRSIERMRFIRRRERISADPSSGGVAPPTIDVLPPCGTSGDAMLGGQGDHRRDFLGRSRLQDRRRPAMPAPAPVGQPWLDVGRRR